MENTLYFLEPLVKPGLLDFQMQPPENKDGRFYFESVVFEAGVVNSRNTEITQAAVESMVDGFKNGVNLMVNHYKSGESVGYGGTVDAEVRDGKLWVLAYLKKDYVSPTGVQSNMLVMAVEDGFLKDVSASIGILESSCSLCKKPYLYGSRYGLGSEGDVCMHYRGQRVMMEDGSVSTCVQVIEKAEPIELSLVYDGATREGQVMQAGVEFSRYGESIDVEKRKKIMEEYPVSKPNEKEKTVEMLQAEVDDLQGQLDAYKQQDTDALIAEGRAARESAIDYALECYGAGKPKATEEDQARQKARLESSSMDEVHNFINDWEPLAGDAFKAGRQTVDHGKKGSENGGDGKENEKPKRRYIPRARV